MGTRRIDLLKRIYDYDPENRKFLLRIAVNKYTDIFNDLDPSPLRRRDLDQDFVNYLEECSSEIPLKYGMDLQIICPLETEDPVKEQRARAGIRTYCDLMMLTLKGETAKIFRKALGYLAVFVVLMFTALLAGPRLQSSVVTDTLLEGLSIGSWVFLWEAIALVSFKRRKIRLSLNRYRRLERAAVEFLYR